MWDFLNQNASAVFTFLTFTVTLTVPYLFKRSELNMLKRNNDYSHYKNVYVNLSHNIGEFYSVYNEICNIIELDNNKKVVINAETKIAQLDLKQYLEVLKKHNDKTKELYSHSLFIHHRVSNRIKECINRQYFIIVILERLTLESIMSELEIFKSLDKEYFESILRLRKVILKYL